MFEGVESKTSISRRRLKHTKLHWLGVGKCKVSESTENWAYMYLFAEKIKKHLLGSNFGTIRMFKCYFLKRLLFSVEYEGIFTTKHYMQHTHQDEALSMPFFIQNFLNKKLAIVMTSTNVTIRYRLALC